MSCKGSSFGEALKPEFKVYSAQVIENAVHWQLSCKKGSSRLFRNGTDNHLMLVDLRCIGMTGKQADQLVSGVNITANKNTVPLIRSHHL